MRIAPCTIGCIGIIIMSGGGCAAGRGDDGAIIIGARVADLPETAEQAAKFAAGFLPEPWSTLTKAAAGLIFGGGAAAYAARRARQREDHAWDEAEARALQRIARAPRHL